MITRILFATGLVFCCSLCLAEDFPEDTNEIKSLNAEQAAELVAMNGGWLELNGLTSIDKDVAKELAKNEGGLVLNGLTSIDKDVAQELVKVQAYYWKELTMLNLRRPDFNQQRDCSGVGKV